LAALTLIILFSEMLKKSKNKKWMFQVNSIFWNENSKIN
jgi:hypothetical protein